MGETEDDRLMLLAELAQLEPPPESIPINCLVPIAGHAAGGRRAGRFARAGAAGRHDAARFPKARVRSSAGRDRMSRELQVLCFLAGANSIFFGDKLLTAPNPSPARTRRCSGPWAWPAFSRGRVGASSEPRRDCDRILES